MAVTVEATDAVHPPSGRIVLVPLLALAVALGMLTALVGLTPVDGRGPAGSPPPATATGSPGRDGATEHATLPVTAATVRITVAGRNTRTGLALLLLVLVALVGTGGTRSAGHRTDGGHDPSARRRLRLTLRRGPPLPVS